MGPKRVERFVLLCLLFGVSFIGGSTEFSFFSTAELILDSGAKSADDLGTLSMELTILSSNNRDCFTITVTDDDEVEDTDEQYRYACSVSCRHLLF